jgi:nucleoside-diphosphate-sugar epimerase
MNILLIGGGGYLGIPLSKELTKKGHNVVVFDKFKYNTQDLIECKKILDNITQTSYLVMQNSKLLEDLYKRMIYYYELKGITKDGRILEADIKAQLTNKPKRQIAQT